MDGPPSFGITRAQAVKAHVGGSSLVVYAIDRPSGEKTGAPSFAAVVTSGFGSPPDTATVEMSFCSNTFVVFWCENTMVELSGDQSRPVTCIGPSVSRFGGRFPSVFFSTETT